MELKLVKGENFNYFANTENPVAKRMKELWDSKYKAKGHEFKADVKNKVLNLYGMVTNGMLTRVGEFLEAVDDKDTIKVRINSYGGDAYAGIAIANRLKERTGKVETLVDGIAASAAAIAFMSGDTRKMQESSQLMFHKVLSFAYGNTTEFRKLISQMDATDKLIGSIACGDGKICMDSKEFDKFLDKEEFMDPKRASEIGAVTEEEKEEKKEEDPDNEGDEEKREKEIEDKFSQMAAEILGFG